MKLSPIVLRLRAGETRFGDMVAGAIELDMAMRNTLSKEIAFVVDLGDKTETNTSPSGVIQQVVERFAVVCAIKNDDELKKQLGILAYDALHDVKLELWKLLDGWDPAADGSYEWAEGPVEYVGSRLLDVNRGYAWYQYEFSVPSIIQSYYTEDEAQINGVVVDVSGLTNISKIWTQYMAGDDPRLPDLVSGLIDIPADSDWMLMEQNIDETDDYRRGAYGGGFSLGYYLYSGD